MTDQAGRPQQPDRNQPSRAGDGAERTDTTRGGSARPGSARPGSARPGSGRASSGSPSADILSDFQRWLIRSSARSMRKEIGGQVRRTFSSGRTESTDVWNVATTEIPPEVGEAPECQWCPICRAARQFRDTGPGIGGHISGAGNAVASAVQDAISAFDSVLSKAAGTSDRDRQGRDGPQRPRPDWQSGTGPDAGAWTTGRTAEPAAPPIAVTPTPIVVPGADSPKTADVAGRVGTETGTESAPPVPAASAVPPGSAGPAAPASPSGTAGSAESTALGSPASEPDAWSLVTDVADGGPVASGAEDAVPGRAQDGGHGPDDRS